MRLRSLSQGKMIAITVLGTDSAHDARIAPRADQHAASPRHAPEDAQVMSACAPARRRREIERAGRRGARARARAARAPGTGRSALYRVLRTGATCTSNCRVVWREARASAVTPQLQWRRAVVTEGGRGRSCCSSSALFRALQLAGEHYEPAAVPTPYDALDHCGGKSEGAYSQAQ